MNNKYSTCRLVNRADAASGMRCQSVLPDIRAPVKSGSRIIVRAAVCLLVCVSVLLGFYLSLVVSAKPLTLEQKNTVRDAIGVLKEKGFSGEAMLLDHFTVFRGDDNWLNASVAKENAYAATNFPFEIMTLYADFFTYPVDDTERAAVLLHEARHLKGEDEKEAYEYVWKNRKKLGWIEDKYFDSPVWSNVRRQTRENAPSLFVCDFNEFSDCTE